MCIRKYNRPAAPVPRHICADPDRPAHRAAAERPQTRNDHRDNWHLDVGPALVEHEEIEPVTLGELHLGIFAPCSPTN
jgi:hypothetical protein